MTPQSYSIKHKDYQQMGGFLFLQPSLILLIQMK